LLPIEGEWQATRTAFEFLERSWPRIGDVVGAETTRFADVRRAAQNLEKTYLIRLFSEFEGILHYFLTATVPRLRIPRTAEALINRVALRQRVPDPIWDAVHRVREYRNDVLHPATPRRPSIEFEQALAALNRFLARLPDPP
jgi:hypothetical protein